MKKNIILAFAIMLFGTGMAQTFVSTTPSNKNVIIEEFTGVNCGYCPDGHRIANELMAAHPNRLWAVNIHTGQYAVQYSTNWGAAIAAQTGLTGYPAGTVNRHAFSSGSATALNRGQWSAASNTILNQQSPVNVAARCTIDYHTRQLTLIVEAYYTGNSNTSNNFLNVMLLQDNILGPQSGGASLNPTQMVGTQYRHMHMLRDMLSGQWGDTISSTTQGSFFTKTYNYTIPATISNETVVPEDLKVIVFVAESHQEILTGCEADMLIIGAQPKVSAVTENNDTYNCDMSFNVKATVKNLGENAITSAVFSYTIDGNTNTYNWSGNIAAGSISEVAMPTINGSFTNGTSYTLSVNLSQVNGQAVSDAGAQTTLSKSSYTVQGPVNMLLHTDKYASETTLKFMKADGTVIKSWGPGTNGSEQDVNLTFDPAEAGCYVLEVYDAYGDGISSSNYGNGYFTLSNADGLIVRDNGTYGALARYYLKFTNGGGSSESIYGAEASNVHIYPNPAEDVLNIVAPELRRVEILDMSGRTVVNANNAQVDITTLAAGIYMVRVTTESGVTLKKVVKK
ncbi:MAG: Omp28-related outer membrane protein [Bacteroidales bacterium]|nr:Omp28-related outer membrane protein [Bacteroidales bacterium]